MKTKNTDLFKICKVCNTEKPKSEFWGGRTCKECEKEIRRNKTKEKYGKIGRPYPGNIPPGTCQYCGAVYPKKNFRRRKNGKLTKVCNPCKWQREDKVKKNTRRRLKEKTDPKTRLSKLMRNGIKKTLISNGIRKNGHTWSSLVDYSLEDLEKHLKKSLRELNKRSAIKYTWEDFMRSRLHIDHKIPITAFSYDSPEHPDFKRCWNLDNLQLLPAFKNISKGGKCQNFQTGF